MKKIIILTLLLDFATASFGQALSGGFTTVFSLGTAEPEYKSYTVPYLLSAACIISGIYLFVASSKNKKKAKRESAFINMENTPVLQGMASEINRFQRLV